MSLQRYFIRMVAFLIFGIILSAILHERLVSAFLSNPGLNSVIIGCFGMGTILIFSRFFQIQKEYRWIEHLGHQIETPSSYPSFSASPDAPFHEVKNKPLFLAPLMTIFADTHHVSSISPLTASSLSASVEARLEESRDMPRYLMGLLIFLGLLGTFWGLSQTISSIAAVVGGLDAGSAAPQQSFDELKQGLQSPLAGMGIAFSSSLFGLAGSLMIGFLDAQANKAAQCFLNDVENRLNGLVRLNNNGDSLALSSPHSGPAYLQGLLEHVTENMSHIQSLLKKHEENRSSMSQSLNMVTEKLSQLSDHMLAQQNVIKKIVQVHSEQQSHNHQLAHLLAHPKGDETTHDYLRSLDATLERLLKEAVDGRHHSVQEIQNELRLVARTISALGN